MTSSQISSAVIIGASENHGQECFLLSNLAVHVDIFKERADAVIGKNLAVKDVDRRVDRGLATELFVQRGFHKYAFMMHNLIAGCQAHISAIFGILRQAAAI